MKSKVIILLIVILFILNCNVYKPYYVVNIEVKQKSPIDESKYNKILFTDPLIEFKGNKNGNLLKKIFLNYITTEFPKMANKITDITKVFDYNTENQKILNYLNTDKNSIFVSIKIELNKKQRSIIKEKKSGIKKMRYFVKVNQFFFYFYYKIYFNKKLVSNSKEEIKIETVRKKDEEFNFKKAIYKFLTKLSRILKGNKLKEKRFLLVK